MIRQLNNNLSSSADTNASGTGLRAGSRVFVHVANDDIQQMIDGGQHLIIDDYIILDHLGSGSFGAVKCEWLVANY